MSSPCLPNVIRLYGKLGGADDDARDILGASYAMQTVASSHVVTDVQGVGWGCQPLNPWLRQIRDPGIWNLHKVGYE